MVRKRKNSDENTVTVPRLTRQRRIVDDEGDPNSMVKEMSPKAPKTPKTPSTARRNTRKKTLASEDDTIDDTKTISTRSQRLQRLKSSSDSETENKVENQVPKSRATLGIESYTTRSRAKKDGNVTLQDCAITLAKEGVSESLMSFPESKKQTKTKQVLTVADNILMESPLKPQIKSTRSKARNLSVIQINPGLDSPIKKIVASKKSIETPKKVSTALAKKPHDSILKLDDTVTPESSPMPVNLTPHRSTKTPKKSPKNIGSPKTHSQSPLRLSKTPRKLTINVESPATSDKSSVSLSNQSPIQNNLLSVNQSEPYVRLTDCQKLSSPITGVVRASESPATFVSNVSLRLRKSGERKLSPKATARSPSLTVDEIWAEVSAASPTKKSPAKKITTLASKIRKSPLKTPTRTPKKTPDHARRSNLLNPESPKRPKSTVKKRSPVTSSGTPLRPIIEGKKITEDKVAASPLIVAPKKINLLLDLANSSPGVTPRGRIRRSLHLTPDFTKFSTGSTSSPIAASKKTESRVDSSCLSFQNFGDSKRIDDESIELVDASNFINASEDVSKKTDGTYELPTDPEIEEKKSTKTEESLEKTEPYNATYELDEPKTPSLKKQSRKRPLSSIEPGKCTPDAKKRCRVRFASPAGNKSPNTPTLNNKKSLPKVKTPAKERIATRLSRGSVGVDSVRRRSRSLTKTDEKTPTRKRRSNSTSDLSNKTPKFSQSIQNSINRLSKPRQSISSESKPEAKIPVPRKVPNFAQIHQKKFAQMESLIDAKQRVAKRHIELNTIPANRSMHAASTSTTAAAVPAPAPTDPQNGAFNRFGFKLRKADAVKVVSKKPPALTRRKVAKLDVFLRRRHEKSYTAHRRGKRSLRFRVYHDNVREICDLLHFPSLGVEMIKRRTGRS